MTPWEMLEELFSEDQFELLFPDPDISSEDLRIVYLMNDAVESFLVLKNARLTGAYQSNYEGKLLFSYGTREEAENSDEERSYYLIVHQGEHVTSIFFEDLQLETSLYNYGHTGHFWVPGYEYLRQLEFRIAILNDKLEYLGPETCTSREKELASLASFPPLNACCYPAVPSKYFSLREDAWIPSGNAIQVMEELARCVQDTGMLRALAIYRRIPTKWIARLIARMLHSTSHAELIQEIAKQLKEEAATYPERDLGEELNTQRAEILNRAEKCLAAFQKQGIQAEVLTEEPFCAAQDSIELHVYLMIWGEKNGNQVVTVEEVRAV